MQVDYIKLGDKWKYYFWLANFLSLVIVRDEDFDNCSYTLYILCISFLRTTFRPYVRATVCFIYADCNFLYQTKLTSEVKENRLHKIKAVTL